MKKALNVLLYIILAAIVVMLEISCSGDNNKNTSDLFPITPEIRVLITEGVMNMPPTEKKMLYAKRDSLISKCSSKEFLHRSTDSLLLRTKEYTDLKSYIVATAPASYYILIEDFLQGDFNSILSGRMFQDLVEAQYPGIISNVLDQLNGVSTEEFIKKYPQLCVEYILEAMKQEQTLSTN